MMPMSSFEGCINGKIFDLERVNVVTNVILNEWRCLLFKLEIPALGTWHCRLWESNSMST